MSTKHSSEGDSITNIERIDVFRLFDTRAKLRTKALKVICRITRRERAKFSPLGLVIMLFLF